MGDEIAVRAYTIIKEKPETKKTAKHRFESFTDDYDEEGLQSLDFNRTLVFDTETTIDRFQNLKVGHFKVFAHLKCVRQGMFFDPDNTTVQERITLSQYCRKNRLELLKVRNFVDNIFLPEVYGLCALCVGFNLPFDLSRLAVGYGYGRGKMNGGFSFTLTEKPYQPRLKIKHVDNGKAFIRFGAVVDKNKKLLSFRGHFVDVYTLVVALAGEKLPLEEACEAFGIKDVSKLKVMAHGRITEEYLDYNVRDVELTYLLLLKAKELYDLFGLDLPITKVYSAASIGKACLQMMGIAQASSKIADISDEVKGYSASTYLGGRTEDKIRILEELVTVLDFTSMYPTMCILMDLWDFIICDHLEVKDCTEEVRQFLQGITLGDLRNPAIWKKMNVVVELEPNGDVLPSRSHYGDENVWNIAVNYITSETALWWALPDVINSKLQTGKIPKILRAFRFVSIGKQVGLKTVKILGKEIDPYKDNLFKWLIEYRQELQRQMRKCKNEAESDMLDKKQRGVKIIANATSYGIFMQVDTEDGECDVIVHGLTSFTCRGVKKKEKRAVFYNPVIATLITSGSRLVLGIVEQLLVRQGACHAYCDTDSMMVPPQLKEQIQGFFQPLNPYSDESVRMFKVDEYKEKNRQKHLLENVWFFGLSSKRYVTYQKYDKGGKIILKASSHGLKHLLNPFSKHYEISANGNEERDNRSTSWHKEVWLDIVKAHDGTTAWSELNEKYDRAFAMSKLAITTPTVMRRFDRLNKGQPYDRQIKPFNFCIVGIGNLADPETGEVIKPLAPFKKDAQVCAYEDFINYNSGKMLNGKHYWKTFSGVVRDYANHREAKFDGSKGILTRKHIRVSSVVHIGKESNDLEVSEVLGVNEDSTLAYSSVSQKVWENKDRIIATPPSKVRQFGIIKETWLRIQRQLRAGRIPTLRGKTAEAMTKFLRSDVAT